MITDGISLQSAEHGPHHSAAVRNGVLSHPNGWQSPSRGGRASRASGEAPCQRNLASVKGNGTEQVRGSPAISIKDPDRKSWSAATSRDSSGVTPALCWPRPVLCHVQLVEPGYLLLPMYKGTPALVEPHGPRIPGQCPGSRPQSVSLQGRGVDRHALQSRSGLRGLPHKHEAYSTREEGRRSLTSQDISHH